MNKYLKLLILIAVVSALGFGLYYLFFSENKAALPTAVQNILNTISGGNQTPEKNAAVENGKKMVKISDLDVFAYWSESKTGDFYLVNKSGQIVRKTNTSEEPVSLQELNRLNAVYPSADGLYAIMKFNYPASTVFSIFNTINTNWQPLPQGTIAAAWSPAGNRVTYLDQTALKIFDLNTKKTSEVMRLSQKDAELFWQNESRILLSVKSDFLTSIYAVDINKKTISPFLEETGMKINWLDRNNYGLKLNVGNNRQTSALIDNNGAVLSQLSFVTLPEKCAADVSAKIIHCAIPKNIPTASNAIEDYYMRGIYTDDSLYFINLADGSYGEIATDNDTLIDAVNLLVQNNSLYFINRLDDRLYLMPL